MSLPIHNGANMHPYKPRASVLYMFDPLAAPRTPERDSPSPDSSDKENDSPNPGQVTAFFNKIYKHSDPASVKTPKGKLIDFASPLSLDIREDEEEEEGLVVDMLERSQDRSSWIDCTAEDSGASEHSITLPSLRQPLADIQLEGPRAEEQASPPISTNLTSVFLEQAEDEELSSSVSPAPRGTPLADVINSINMAGLSISDNDTKDEPAATAEIAGPSSSYPEITICPPTSPTSSDSFGSTSTSSQSWLSPPSSSPPAQTVGRRLHVASPDDPRRASVDLQSSFYLHMQSPDMSFDLLNDKISFLGHDSYTSGDDDTMDLKKECAKMLAIAEEPEKQLDEVDTLILSISTSGSSDDAPPVIITEETLPRPPVFSLPKKSPSPPRPSLESQRDPASPTDKQPAQIAVQATPAPATTSVRTLPALKIIKRSFKTREPATPSLSVTPGGTQSRSSSGSSTITARSLSPDENKPPVVPAAKPKTVVRGVQRPPPGAQLPPPAKPATSGLAKMIASRSSSTNTPVAPRPTFSTRPTGVGPQRPPVGSKLQRPISSAPKAFTSAVPSSKATLPVKSLRGSSSSSSIPASRSAIPVPPSRLPGPGAITSRIAFAKRVVGSTGVKRAT